MNIDIEQALELLNRHRHRDSDQWHRVPGLRKPHVRRDASASSASWLSEFEAVAIAERYLREQQPTADDSIDELKIFLCRGGGVELLGVRPEHGDRGAMMPMIAGDEQRVAELREIARAQMRQGIMSDFRLCRFVNVETVEVIGRDWRPAI
jgi:hypothetical protein